MPLATTGKPPSITTPDIMKRRHTTLHARGQAIQARKRAEDAVMVHTEEHGKK
jgi:hypothetical protein